MSFALRMLLSLTECRSDCFLFKFKSPTLSQNEHDFFKKMFLLVLIFSIYNVFNKKPVKSKILNMIRKNQNEFCRVETNINKFQFDLYMTLPTSIYMLSMTQWMSAWLLCGKYWVRTSVQALKKMFFPWICFFTRFLSSSINAFLVCTN